MTMSRRFRIPCPPTPKPSADAFVMIPASALPPRTEEEAERQRALYQWAMEEAAAAVRPSLPERDLLGTWN
jgi:hypothetical protein